MSPKYIHMYSYLKKKADEYWTDTLSREGNVKAKQTEMYQEC